MRRGIAKWPVLIVVFVVLVGVNSAGWIPASAAGHIADLSRACLVAAIAALGVMTSFKELAALGWRPVILMVSETAFLAILIATGLLFLRG